MALSWTFGYIAAMVFIMLYETSCHSRVQQNRWNEAVIDRKLSENMIFFQLDKQTEIFSFGEKQDSLIKRTSDVAYLTGEKINLPGSSYSKYNNCRANLVHDTLRISIGIADGFVGWGFVIEYYDKNFCTEPYHWTDADDPYAPKPTYRIVSQNLTLNKAVYKIGDSLYGQVSFKTIETNRDINAIEHLGKGSFRTKVEGPSGWAFPK